MNNGIALFFEGEFNCWFCTNVTYHENTIRGYVQDGCWWMDYNTKTDTVNVCIGRSGGIDWENPINVMTKLSKPVIITVENMQGSYNEVMEWAKNEWCKKMA